MDLKTDKKGKEMKFSLHATNKVLQRYMYTFAVLGTNAQMQKYY